jgi:hypothetical protein
LGRCRERRCKTLGLREPWTIKRRTQAIKSDEEDWPARTSFPAANGVEDGADHRLQLYRKRAGGRWYAGAPRRDCSASIVG